MHVTQFGTFRCTAVGREPPIEVQRATVTPLGNTGHFRFDGCAEDTLLSPPPPTSLRAFIDSWEDGWPLRHCRLPDTMDHILTAITQGTALACCDGSYMPLLSDTYASTAWILESPCGSTARGVCPVSGPAHDVNAYRGELQGIHCLMLFLEVACTFFGITQGTVLIGCDNKNGVNRSLEDWLRVPSSVKHSDLIKAI